MHVFLVYFCIACGNCYHFRLTNGSNFACNTKVVCIQTLQLGYIFRILQHFATKLCSFTNLDMLFLGVFFSKIKKLVYNGNCLLSVINQQQMYILRYDFSCKNNYLLESTVHSH
jgi:hypothetical protein